MLYVGILFAGKVALGGVPEVVRGNEGELDFDKKIKDFCERVVLRIPKRDRERDSVLPGVVVLRGPGLQLYFE